ncbi:MAG: 8-oxo-dGTP diphosphatase MutT [Firmicutes bacterium HGW-Firmicutes-2]|jgi:8-oxo-dGTP diphosphatase|nr:MAG: 8-oxo-dGTP diphosphatase MutT [Firmicutes bacterium HGW-Firmicutes-2]
MSIYVVAAIIRNKENQMLIARRREGKSLAGYFEFPGGKVDEGESHEVALIREIYEELGLHIEVGTFIEESEYTYEFGTIHLHGYVCTIIGEIPDKINSIDHDEVLWIDLDETERYRFAPADIPIVAALSG